MLIKRSTRYFFQRLIRGFDDSATWSVDFYVAKTLLPVIRRYKKIGLPKFIDEPDEDGITTRFVVDETIYAFEKMVETKTALYMLTQEERDRVYRGLELFGKHMDRMWW